MDSPYEFNEKIEQLEKILTDNTITSVRLVTNPEKMVVKESLRSHAYLSLYGVATDLIIANRIIPEAVEDPHFQAWKRAQQHYLQQIHEDFSPLPVKEIPLYAEELVGWEALERLRTDLWSEEDPAHVFHQETTMTVSSENGQEKLELYLPGVPKEQIQMTKNGDELNIKIGNYRRNLVVPQTLATKEPTKAKMEADHLKIYFAS